MSDLLGIGASGVSAYRSALSVIGDNIVNSETPGYARRTVVLRESGISGSNGLLYRGLNPASGVEAVGFDRAWDEFKAADSRIAAGADGRAATRVRWLTTTEAALDDGTTGIGQSLTTVFTSADTLATDPGNGGARRGFLVAIDNAADAFRTTAETLGRTADGIAKEATTLVDATNADLAALAKINQALRRVGPGTSASAQLSDERDRLLDSLAARLDIVVTPGGAGSVAVTLGRGGDRLVDAQGQDPARLSLVQAADGRLSLQSVTGVDVAAVSPGSGQLAGLVETAALVADRRDQLDALAVSFATALNDWSLAGTDANDAPGTALLAYDAADPAATIAAAVAGRDPATIAAALSVDNGDGTFTVTANGNLLNLPALRGTGGVEQRWSTIVAGQSQILASAKSEAETAAARRDGAFAARDDVSGIDPEREASDLLRFQQAYNGSAKIIQVARETLQTIFEIL